MAARALECASRACAFVGPSRAWPEVFAGAHALRGYLHNLDDHVKRLRVLSDRISGRLSKSVVEHRRVQAALSSRDPAAAEQAMRDHLLSVIQDLCAPGE